MFQANMRTSKLLTSGPVRKFHVAHRVSQEASNNARPDTTPLEHNHHFKSQEEELESIRERNVYRYVFDEITRKEELRKKKQAAMLADSYKLSSRSAQQQQLQVVFGQSRKDLTSQDRKLVEFFKEAVTRKNDSSNGKGSSSSPLLTSAGVGPTELMSEDIRNFPVSLVPDTFSGHEGGGTARLSRLDLGLKSNIIQSLQLKQKLKTSLGKALQPYLNHVISGIKTDYDLFQYLEQALNDYSQSTEAVGEKEDPIETVEKIGVGCTKNPTILPQPYTTTLPFVIVELLTSDSLAFSSDRKYSILHYIYQRCKTSKDISLYLNICNVDFYNLLLQLTWQNYKEIHQIRKLTAEMSINGILGDLDTIDILDKIAYQLRYINDGILDEQEEPTAADGTQPLSVGVVWCRENSHDLMVVEGYLRKLKESLT